MDTIEGPCTIYTTDGTEIGMTNVKILCQKNNCEDTSWRGSFLTCSVDLLRKIEEGEFYKIKLMDRENLIQGEILVYAISLLLCGEVYVGFEGNKQLHGVD